MKKVKSVVILLFCGIAFSFIGCKVNVETEEKTTPNKTETPAANGGETGGEGSETITTPEIKRGDVVRANIVIGTTTFDKTKEIVIIPAGKTAVIEMKEEPTNYNGKGVFIKDRQVTLSPFVMGAFEVTQELYEAVMGSNPSYCKATESDYKNMLEGEKQNLRPVERVTWYNCIAFCNELTKKTLGEENCVYFSDEGKTTVYTKENATGKVLPIIDMTKSGYRLPTEAEWEFATRGGDLNSDEWKKAYTGVQTEKESFTSGGYDASLNEYAWYRYNISGEDKTESISSGTAGYGTHEVGKKLPNVLGLYDMSGNVWEWCWDKDGTITTEAVTDPLGGSSSSHRVFRGGSWSDYSYRASVSSRRYCPPDNRESNLGFRLVRSSS